MAVFGGSMGMSRVFHSVRSGVMLSVLALAACGSSHDGGAAVNAADLLIINGRVFTADATGTTAEALAVRGNTILLVGSTAEVSKLRDANTRIIDAHGGSVIPGMNDAHVHFISGALSLKQMDLGGLNTLGEVQAAIRKFATANPGSGWLQGRGWLYTPFPGASPTREQLDAVVSDRPVVMQCYDGHSIWVNSRALQLAGITRNTTDPPNGVIVKDPKTGEPTGHLKESAARLVSKVIPPLTDADRRTALRTASAYANSLGVTSIQNPGATPEEMAAFEAARRDGDLTVRAYVAYWGSAQTTDADADMFVQTWQRLGDGATLRGGFVKLAADGVIEAHTAAMLAPYANHAGTGIPNFTADELNRVVALLDKRGLQVTIHAIGDRAIHMSLDAFERAAKVNPAPTRGRRHRIEHVEAIAEADIARFGALGVIASQQPMHVALGDMNQKTPHGPWPDNVGPERYGRAWSWRRSILGPASGWRPLASRCPAA